MLSALSSLLSPPLSLSLSPSLTRSLHPPCTLHPPSFPPTPNGWRDERLVVGCYVDDLATIYSHDDKHSLYADFVGKLQQRFNVEDEGPISDLLNVEIDRDENDGSVTLRQTGYIERLEKEFLPDGIPTNFQRNKPPCEPSLPQHVADALSDDSARDERLVKRYQSLVGALLYASVYTRPDIAYSVGMLCRAMSKPTPELYNAGIQVLCYLVLHKDVGLRYEGNQQHLEGMTDSDWAVKRSTTGWTYQYCSAAISWSSKKQDSIALSSCEAEIMAASEAAKEALYLNRFLDEFGLKGPDPVNLRSDNKGAIDLAYNPEHHQRTKHIERRHFFIREAVERMEIRVPYVATCDNLADFFTKPLASKQFFAMRNTIMNYSAIPT